LDFESQYEEELLQILESGDQSYSLIASEHRKESHCSSENSDSTTTSNAVNN